MVPRWWKYIVYYDFNKLCVFKLVLFWDPWKLISLLCICHLHLSYWKLISFESFALQPQDDTVNLEWTLGYLLLTIYHVTSSIQDDSSKEKFLQRKNDFKLLFILVGGEMVDRYFLGNYQTGFIKYSVERSVYINCLQLQAAYTSSNVLKSVKLFEEFYLILSK